MTKMGGVYTPKTTVDYEKLVASVWFDKYGMLSLDGKLRVTIHVYTDRTHNQDVDNLAKTVLDGLQRAGAFTHGDEQVWSLGVIKYASETPQTLVSITRLPEYDE